MKIGPLFIGWLPINNQTARLFDLEYSCLGWEVFCVMWGDSGFTIIARKQKGLNA